MTQFTPLLETLNDIDQNRIIAYDETKNFHLSDLQSFVNQLKTEIASQNKTCWVLAVEDVFSFAAGFLALASLNFTIILPPNLKLGAIEDIALQNESILTDKTFENSKLPILKINPISAAIPSISATKASPNSTCTIELFTSGSSGEPKKITKSLQNIETELQTLEKYWGTKVTDCVYFSTVTHLHIYGLLFRLLWPLTTKRPFFNKSYLFPEDLEKAMASFSKIALISSPAHLKRIPQMTTLSSFCNKIKMITSSGGPLDFATANVFTTDGLITPMEIFGSTETGGIAWRNQATENTPWQAFENIKIKQNSETGTLSLQSPYIQETEFVETSDLIEVIAPNTFHLKGRADRIVKIEEKRIGLNHLESKILETGLVQDVYVTQLASAEQNGRLFLGCIISLNEFGKSQFLKLSWKPFVETIKQKLAQFFDLILIPRQWRLVLEMPLNQTGKKVASQLNKLFNPSINHQPITLQEEIAGNQVKCQLCMPADLLYFQGHFDGFPVLPGVTQVNWAVLYAKKYFGVQGKFYQMTNVKFKRIIRPGEILTLEICHDPIKNAITYNYQNDKDAFSSGVIKFKTSDKTVVS